MPSFLGDEAKKYDSRISRLVPGYSLLHQLTSAQLQTLLPDNATLLIIGAGTGKEVIELAALNESWQFIAQDISSDMLEIADHNFTNLGLSCRVDIYHGDLSNLTIKVDAAVCLLVSHFLPDNGEKLILLKSAANCLIDGAHLFLADLMLPESSFERESQLLMCRYLGLSEIAEQRMRHNLAHEFFPLSQQRLFKLLKEAGLSQPKPFFKSFGFTGYSCQKNKSITLSK